LRYIFFYFICCYLIKEKKFAINKIFFFYSIFALIISVDVIIQHTLGYNIIGIEIKKFGLSQTPVATSFFMEEPIAGSFIQMFGFYLAFVVFNKFDKKNILHLTIKIVSLFLISFSIFVSFQRMPMVLWMFFLTIYGIVFYKSKLLPIILSFAILALFINNFSSKEINESYKSFFDNIAGVSGSESVITKTFKNYKIINNKKAYDEIKSDSIKAQQFEGGSGHGSLYANAIFIWRDYKIFGIGYKNFYNKCNEKKLTRCSTHPHNYYLDILVSTGLVGFSIMLIYLTILCIKIFFSLRKKIENKNSKAIDFLFITVINFLIFFFPLKSSGSFFTTANSTYMIITLVILISQLENINFKKKYKI
tara:strand:- start:45 stop:1133 length:1089 start_codon:yes stop_codon:yes gene_type:complete